MNPAPTDVSNTRSPFFSRPVFTASLSASGIVAAVVLPKRSMLMTTFSSRTSMSDAQADQARTGGVSGPAQRAADPALLQPL